MHDVNSRKTTSSNDHISHALSSPPDTSELPSSPADALSRLHWHDFVECISDRVHRTVEYPFEGREELLNSVLHSITRGDSVLLVGEPGIGRRTISLGLARRLAALRFEHPSDPVYSRAVYTLCLGASFWNHSRDENLAQIQESIRYVFRLVERAGPEKIIFCIDDVDVLSFVDRLVKEKAPANFNGTGELARDMANPNISTENMLRFLLFSKKVLCLCTCISGAYERLRQSDTYYDEKFTKSFRVLHMTVPNRALTAQIVHAHRLRMEAEHHVVIPEDSLNAAMIYAENYITHRAAPEKVLDLLQEACKMAISDHRSFDGRHREEESPEEHDMGLSAGQVNGSVVVYKRFVDRLVQKWCGVSSRQLRDCLAREGVSS